jgi:hypothetical protein
MEELIKQAFLHVEVIGPHVSEGHYDLVGPNGEIILPQVWETMIEPDWLITMHMWPIPEPDPRDSKPKLEEWSFVGRGQTTIGESSTPAANKQKTVKSNKGKGRSKGGLLGYLTGNSK